MPTQNKLFAVWLLLAGLLIGGLVLTSHPAMSQSTGGVINSTLETAFGRWMREKDGEGRFRYGDLETAVAFDSFLLQPKGAGDAWVESIWWRDTQGNVTLLVKATIYNCTTTTRAQQEYNRIIAENQSVGSVDFHGFTNTMYYLPPSLNNSLVWIHTNLVFDVHYTQNLPPILMDVLNYKIPLQEYIYEEAVKNGLIPEQGGGAAVAPANPPAQAPRPATTDSDQDGYPDHQDACRTRAAPNSGDGCPPFGLQITCGPEAPAADEIIACLVEAIGAADNDTVDYTWQIDGVTLCQGLACQWQARQGGHSGIVNGMAKPSGKQASRAVSVTVGGWKAKVVDDPTAGFVITNLGCSNEISSDEVMECAAGFKRGSPEIQELVVVWLVDGQTVSTSTRSDDGDFYNLAQPAPGVHTIEVQVSDPRSGKARLLTTTARIFPGKNAAIPPATGAAASAGALTGVAVWMWAQWWASKQTGRTVKGSPVSKLPDGPRVHHTYTGDQAKELLKALNIYDDLNKLDASDLRDPDYLARREELLDTRFDKRKVKGIHYETRKNPATGREEIIPESLVVLVEEPETGPSSPAAVKKKPAKKAPTGGAQATPPAKPADSQPPAKKTPPAVDKREQELRKLWQDRQKELKEKTKEREKLRDQARKAADETAKAKARLHAEVDSRKNRGIVDAVAFILSGLIETGMFATGAPPQASIPVKFVINLAKHLVKEEYSTTKSTRMEHVTKTTGIKDTLETVYPILSKLPSGLVKDIAQWTLEKIEIVKESSKSDLFLLGQAIKLYNAYRDNANQTVKVDALMAQKNGFFKEQLKIETQFKTAEIESKAARVKVQRAWEALDEHLKKKGKR